METNGDHRGRFVKGLLAGGILGALAGMLFAPKPGKELRSDLRLKGTEVLDKTKQISSDTQAKAIEILEGALHLAEKVGIRKQAEGQKDITPPV